MESGTCSYEVTYKVISQTSGNELLGPKILLGELLSMSDAETFLANHPSLFKRVSMGSNVWIGNNGYSRAYIEKSIRHLIISK